MEGDRPRALLETRSRLGRELDRPVIHGRDRILRHPRRLEHAGFFWLDLIRMKAEQDDAVLLQQWESWTDVGEVRIALAYQVRHAHRVEDARVCRLRRRQVGVAVEVDQAEIGLMAQQSGHDAERDGAIAAKHDRDQLALDRSLDGVGDLAGDLDHLRLALTLALDPIWRKADHREIAQVLEFEAGFSQRAHQPGCPQRGRCPFLPGAMGTGTGRDADQPEPHRSSSYGSSTRTRMCEPSRTIRRSPSGVGAPHIPHRSTIISCTAGSSSLGSTNRTCPSTDGPPPGTVNRVQGSWRHRATRSA